MKRITGKGLKEYDYEHDILKLQKSLKAKRWRPRKPPKTLL